MQLKYVLVQLFFIFLELLSIDITSRNKEMDNASRMTDLVDT